MTFTKFPLSKIIGAASPALIHSSNIIDKPLPQFSIKPPRNITFAMIGFGGNDVFS